MKKAIVVYLMSKENKEVPRLVIIADGDTFKAIGDPDTKMGRMARSMQSDMNALRGKERQEAMREIFNGYRRGQDGYTTQTAIYDYEGADKKRVDAMYDTLAAKSFKPAKD